MNCQEFESVVRDLARDSDRSSELWDSAGSHLGGCTRCSARMDAEKALQAGLGQLGSKVRKIEAPAQLEARMLGAFRQKRDTRRPVRSFRWRLAGWRWALAGGTLVLLTFALAWRRPLEWGPIPAKPEVQHAKAIPDVSAERLKDSGAMDERKEPAQKTQVTYSHKGMKSRRLPRRQPPSIQMDGKATENQRTLKDLEAETAYFEPEVATEFIPFMAVGGTFPEEQQQLVRVKLPRSALETFGLPVNRERVRDPVQADMLIGEDGLVRAIRFVH